MGQQILGTSDPDFGEKLLNAATRLLSEKLRQPALRETNLFRQPGYCPTLPKASLENLEPLENVVLAIPFAASIVYTLCEARIMRFIGQSTPSRAIW
jgi:hypothetical protein